MKTIFESENISFTEVSELLTDDYLTMINDYENVNRYIGSPNKTFTREQEIGWARKKLEEKAPVFSMIEKKSGRFIGNIEFMSLTDTQGELGIALTAEMQDRGYGTEAITAFTRYGMDVLGLKRIYLRSRLFNARAIHVYEKCGFREYGRDDVLVYMELTR